MLNELAVHPHQYSTMAGAADPADQSKFQGYSFWNIAAIFFVGFGVIIFIAALIFLCWV